MPIPQHNEAQEISSNAENALRNGRRAEALELYKKAAELESQAFATTDATKERTKNILAVSWIALLYKAEEFQKAEQTIYKLLADGELLEAARTQLKDLLESVWDERTLANMGLHYAGEEISISLKGGAIGSGTAPLETALHYMSGLTTLMYRVAEWQNQLPFRTRGLPPKSVQSSIEARAIQPAAGSYKFAIKLVQPLQKWLFDDWAQADTQKISETFMNVLRSATMQDSPPLSGVITDKRYRTTVAKLIRNVVPNTRTVNVVEIRNLSPRSAQSVILMPGSRSRIAEQLRSDAEAVGEGTPVKYQGVLRALNLDKHWLEIVLPDGKHQKFTTKPDEVDDVIGPMVNRSVIAYGSVRGSGSPLLLDIEMVETQEGSAQLTSV